MNINSVQYIRSGDGTINIFVNGKIFTVSLDFPTYTEIDKVLKSGETNEDSITKLLNVNQTVQQMAKRISHGKVKIDLNNNIVWYDGIEFPDEALCKRILRLIAEQQPFEYMVNFLERLAKNPNIRSVMELFKFIKGQGFPITPDGKILCYKGVDENFKDCYTGTFDNSVGCVNKMPRPECDEDWRKECSSGFHVGTYHYALNFGSRMVLVEVDPADVVAVPENCETWKMRCCKYKVVADHTGNSILKGEIYNYAGNAFPAKIINKFDNDIASCWDDSEGRQYGNYEVGE